MVGWGQKRWRRSPSFLAGRPRRSWSAWRKVSTRRAGGAAVCDRPCRQRWGRGDSPRAPGAQAVGLGGGCDWARPQPTLRTSNREVPRTPLLLAQSGLSFPETGGTWAGWGSLLLLSGCLPTPRRSALTPTPTPTPGFVREFVCLEWTHIFYLHLKGDHVPLSPFPEEKKLGRLA